MSELSDTTRALIAVSRGGDDASAAELDRVGRALMAKVAAGAATAAATASASKAAALGGTLGVKLTAGLALGVALTGAVWLGHAKPDASGGAAPPQRSAGASPRSETSLAPNAPEPRPLASAMPSAVAPQKTRLRKPPSMNVEAEASLLSEAQRALGAGRNSDALSLLGEYDRRFPNGMLRIEADATHVLALCRAGARAAGVAATQRFLERYPDSLQASRVRQACRVEAPAPKTALSSAPGTGRP